LRKKEGNVLAITGTDSPMTSPAIPFMDSPVGGKSNPMTLALRESASSTAKKTKDNQSDDDEPIVIETREPKIPGFKDASVGDNRGGTTITHPTRPLIPFPSNTGVKSKKEAVQITKYYLNSDKGCKDFINEFLKQLSKKTGHSVEGGIDGILDRFLKDSNSVLDHKITDRTYFGFQGPGDNRVLIETPGTFDIRIFALFFIHELTHWESDSFGDTTIMQTLQQSGLAMSVDDYIKAFPRNVIDPSLHPESVAMHKLSGLYPNAWYSPPKGINSMDGAIKR
jgi:hypothetical protein